MYWTAATIATVITLTSGSVVKWVPNGSFNLPNNFKDGKLPCSKQTVVLPETLSGSVKLESVVNMGGFILPTEGDIILDGIMMFGDDGDANCTEGNTFYLDKSTFAWNQAGAWSSSRFNEATPDSERMPCYDDIVEFSNTRYTAELPNAEQYVRDLKIGDEQYTTDSFRNRVTSDVDEEQTFVLNDYLATGVNIKQTICNDKFGCPCQRHPLEIDCSVKFCTQPSCIAPVKPVGFCCKVCGGYITFELDDTFNRNTFEELVNKTVNSYGTNLVYHIGFTPMPRSQTLQLVVVETGEYTGASAEAINFVDRSVQRNWFKGQQATFSGSPLSKAGMGGKIFVSVFFAVVLVIGAIYLYYYKLPPMEVPFMNRSTRGMFSRFQRRTDSVVSLTRRDSTVIGGVRTAFRNPLYDSKRGRVQVAESVVEE